MTFQSKVLIPTVLVMALLQALLMWIVNRRFTAQFSEETTQTLNDARSVFTRSEKIRTRNRILQYRNWANEPRVKSLFAASEDANETFRNTLRNFLSVYLLEELEVDFGVFVTPETNILVSVGRDAAFNQSENLQAVLAPLSKALQGPSTAELVPLNSGLYDLVSIPVMVSGNLAGVLAVGNVIDDKLAQEMQSLTHSEIAIISNGKVVASSFENREVNPQLVEEFNKFAAQGSKAEPVAHKTVIGNVHYLSLVEKLGDSPENTSVGYVILSSYQKPLEELYATQRMLLALGIIGIVTGAIAVWLIVRKMTAPLRELRAGAAAVGRGDFQWQVRVNSNDECGALATAFNEMTRNLRHSQQELDKTMESLKTTQAQLIQREKLSALGEFVAGITHELNNPLTVMIGFAELLQDVDRDEKHQRYLKSIVAGAERCRKIVKSLLSFARQHPPERKWVHVNDLIDATLAFMHYEMNTSNIAVERKFGSQLPLIHADPHQLQQVFLNLVNNARQAMEKQNGGKLEVRSSLRNNKVVIEFQDNGPGISAENKSKIFTPFFTTKEIGKGTGLGLSVSYGIVHEHGGSIHLQSEVGQGTTFTIELPCETEQGGKYLDQVIDDLQGVNRLNGHGNKVLVIDDEQAILDLIHETLETAEFKVEKALNGESALQLIQRGNFDLVLCDMKMPGLNGEQVFERARNLNKGVGSRFIFMTGDVINENTRAFLEKHQAECLSKPFSLQEFRELVAKQSF